MPEDKIVDAGVEGEEIEETQDTSTDTNVETPEQSNEPESNNGDWEAKFNQMVEHNKALNRKVVELMRQANASKGLYKSKGQANDSNPEQPAENDFIAAKERASFRLMKDLGGILDLYPELSARDRQRILNNPWAYTSDETYVSLNLSNALLEIEEYVASVVDEMDASENEVKEETPAPRVPKQVKPNPAPEALEDEESSEEENLYTMPMDQLEKRANQARKRLMSK